MASPRDEGRRPRVTLIPTSPSAIESLKLINNIERVDKAISSCAFKYSLSAKDKRKPLEFSFFENSETPYIVLGSSQECDVQLRTLDEECWVHIRHGILIPHPDSDKVVLQNESSSLFRASRPGYISHEILPQCELALDVGNWAVAFGASLEFLLKIFPGDASDIYNALCSKSSEQLNKKPKPVVSKQKVTEAQEKPVADKTRPDTTAQSRRNDIPSTLLPEPANQAEAEVRSVIPPEAVGGRLAFQPTDRKGKSKAVHIPRAIGGRLAPQQGHRRKAKAAQLPDAVGGRLTQPKDQIGKGKFAHIPNAGGEELTPQLQLQTGEAKAAHIPDLDPELSPQQIIWATNASLVFKAEYKGKLIAAKICRDKSLAHAVSNWINEKDILRRINHRNIVGLQGFNAAYLSLHLDYVSGENLSRHVDSSNNSTIEEAVGYNIWKGISSALAYIHEKGIIHHDIKPGNIILQAEGLKPVLCDFGIAATTSRYYSGGTPSYIPPEVIRELRGSPSDIWAFGIVMLFVMKRVALPRHNWRVLDITQSRNINVLLEFWAWIEKLPRCEGIFLPL
ncbi:hypothetical protein FQN57_002553 [Myotisia sp. PD_48]|nr:hypothetical protein FQN57_002553 [Myotisia sp. PD_48]